MPDQYEDNDALLTAFNLGTLSGVESLTNLSIDDDDWFQFTTLGTGTADSSVQIDFLHAAGDIDLRLVDANGELIAASDSTGDRETLSLDGLAAGRYYIHVYGFVGVTNPNYTLTIAPPPSSSAISPDSFEPNNSQANAIALGTLTGSYHQFNNLSIHEGNNDDWFQFTIATDGAAGDAATIQFDSELGDIDLELYSQNGDLLVYSYGDGDTETVRLDGLAAGTYSLRIYGYLGATQPDYSLTIDAPEAASSLIAEDGAEQNDTLGQAYALPYVGGYDDFSALNLTMDDSANESSKQDWFKFNLPIDGIARNQVTIEFNHALGDLDLALYDSNGNVVGRSEGVENQEAIALAGMQAGDYYIQVYGYQNATNPSYELAIDGPTPGSLLQPDALEANDTLATATNLGALTGTGNLWQTLNISPAGDQDWFQFTTAATGTVNDFVQINFNHGAGDLALTMYDSTGNFLSQTNGAIDHELVSLQGLAAGTYYAQVSGVNGATNPNYTLGIHAPSQPGAPQANWTILVYLDADNDLEAYGIEDLNEMEIPVLPNGVRVVTLVDRIPGYDGSNGNWAEARRGLITHDSNEALISSPLLSLGEMNMGAPQTLTDFIQWGVQTNPAENYGLVLWNHGGGLSGVTWDDTNNNDNLTLREITDAIQTSGVSFDLIGFDACLQSLVEQGYELQNLTDVMVASQETEPGDGWDYTAWLNQLAANPTMGAEDLAAAIVSTYGEFYGNNETLAATRVGDYGELKTALNNFATTALTSATESDWQAIATARNTAQFFSLPEYRDLKTFTDAIAANPGVSGVVRATAEAVSIAMSNAVIRNHSGTSEGGTGLSIYLPEFGDVAYTADLTAFYSDTNWLNFLNRAPVGGVLALDPDWAEVNDGRSQATNLHRLAGANKLFTGLTIGTSSDVDWFHFETVNTGSTTDSVQIAFDPTGGDLTLQLYSASGALLQTSTANNTDTTAIEQVSLNTLLAGQYFLKVDGLSGGLNAYNLTINAPQSDSIIEDWAERNDSREQAYALGTIGVEETRFPGLTMDGTANEPNREDWFVITSNRGTEWNPNKVSIEFDHSQGNLDLSLYDADGNPINPLQGVTDGNGETVIIPEVSGKIYVQVAGRDATVTNPDYTLVLRGSPALPNSFPIVQGAVFTIAENSLAGTSVGAVIASDPENSLLTYALTAGNTDGDADGVAVFAIDSTTGLITVADSDELNFEPLPAFNLNVQVTDAAGRSTSGAIAINLVDVPEAPLLQAAVFQLPENSLDGTGVGQVQATDPDGEPITYSIAAGNSDTDGNGIPAFSIDSLTGSITVADSDELDYEQQPSIILAIAAQDSSGLTTIATTTINLLNIVGGRIQGTRGDDWLVGDDSDDVIIGGYGNDVITTAGGRDRVVFDIGRSFRQTSIGVDEIIDFDRRFDRIVLDKTTFKAIEGRRITFDSVKTTAKATRSEALFTYVRATGALYYNENGTAGGFGSGGQFARLEAGVNLTNRSLMVQA